MIHAGWWVVALPINGGGCDLVEGEDLEVGGGGGKTLPEELTQMLVEDVFSQMVRIWMSVAMVKTWEPHKERSHT